LALAVNAAASSGARSTTCRADDRAVIEAALTDEVKRLSPERRYLVMYDETVTPRVSEPDDFLKHFKSDVARSVAGRNSVSATLPAAPAVRGVRFVPAAERSELFSSPEMQAAEAWRAFYRVFPKAAGLINVSLPGYSQSNCSSLLYLERQGGELAAEGALVSLKWRDGAWRVTRRRVLWSS
jgi:hypothetical protein